MNYILVGHGGHSRVIQEMIESAAPCRIAAYLDDRYQKLVKRGDIYYGPVSAARSVLSHVYCGKLVIAVTDNLTRKSVVKRLNLADDCYTSVISTHAIISPSAEIGAGTVVMPGAIVNAEAKIGKHGIINTASVVEHNCRLSDFAHISSKACLTSGVKVREGVLVGANATVIPDVEIGQWAVVGAGATVTSDVPEFAQALGVPAKVVNKEKGGGFNAYMSF